MATRKTALEQNSKESGTTGDRIEEKVVAFAKELGFLVGTVQAKTEGWLDRESLTKEIGRIRDSAAELLNHVNPNDPPQLKTATKQASKTASRQPRGPVDAPGKRHRSPCLRNRSTNTWASREASKWGRRASKTIGVGVRG